MPIKCKCPNQCKVHNQCDCGNIKKVVSDCCRTCYYQSLPKYACKKCGKKRKKTTSDICRNCYNKGRTERILNDTTPIKETFYECGRRNRYNNVRHHATRLISSLNLKEDCVCCGFSKGVQICHIKPISSFDESTAMNIVNSLDNLILLCPNCHWLFDHGHDSLEKLKLFYSS